MTERVAVQQIPVKMYRAGDRLTVAAPMPGLGPEDISVEVTREGYLVLNGKLRGALKTDAKEILADEWSVGPYHRNVLLPVPVDGPGATVTYGNGVLMVALLIAVETRPTQISLERVGPARGEGRAVDERDAA
jgi:HSP20 family protein